jgi:hypothetical protein
LPATNVAITDCDIDGSYDIFTGDVAYSRFSRNTIWNGGIAFYIVNRQTIIEDNDNVGSSVMSAGYALHYAQHLYMARNRVRFVRGNDRYMMTLDGTGSHFYGTPLSINETHVVAPNCPYRIDAHFAEDIGVTAAGSYNNPQSPMGALLIITDGPGAGQHRRVVDWGHAGNIDSEPCWWRLNRPFEGLLDDEIPRITLVVTIFAGRLIFEENNFQDAGRFSLYHSGIEVVASGHRTARTEGFWATGMVVAGRYVGNNSRGPLIPNPSYFAEFSDNIAQVGHRAPHTQQLSADSFWNPKYGLRSKLFSFGIGGEGKPEQKGVNRFVVFRRNEVVGGNGVRVWGISNSDMLVEGNTFRKTNISVEVSEFAGKQSVENVLVRNNTEV